MPRLADLVRISSRFRRAINIERDTGRPDCLDGYVITPAVRAALVRVLDSLRPTSRERAWTLTGPYGSGKSALAVFLTDLLRPGDDGSKKHARQILRDANFAIAGWPNLLPVAVSCERGPLDRQLLSALERSLSNVRRQAKIDQVIRRTKRALASGDGSVGARQLIECFETAFDALRSHGFGLLLVVDEAGKMLEFAAQHPERGDILVLQCLAELAARSEERPFVVLTVLHQGFEQYATRLGTARRNEWAKIQGRFADLVFQEGIDQLVHLTARALEHPGKLPPRPAFKAIAQTVAEAVCVRTGWSKARLSQSLEDCWPLHPMTATILGPVFRGRFAQNERSLFAFLGSDEPLGFRDFVRQEDDIRSLYSLSKFHDYLVANLASRIYGQEGKAWAEIEAALNRLPAGSNEIDAEVVKSCGVLSIFGESLGLSPSLKNLSTAIGNEVLVHASVKRLEKAGLLLYRRYKDAYVLWEGSDIDIERLVLEARGRLAPELSVSQLLNTQASLRPVVARRHLFETGTLRYFELLFVEPDELSQPLVLPRNPRADGSILLMLPSTSQQANSLKEQLQNPLVFFAQCPGEGPVVVGVPDACSHLTANAIECHVLEHIVGTTPSLQTDRVALREVSARLTELRRQLHAEIQSTFSAGGCSWYSRGGSSIQRPSPRQFSEWLSSLCGRAFEKSPVLHNELLNRDELSSAAAKARRNLLEAMVCHPDKERLAIVGFPPEYSMYCSLLEASGWHARSGTGWRFVKPKESGMSAVWNEIQRFLDETEAQRLPLVDLYGRLQRSPFGLKKGPIPVIVCAALLTLESEVAVYEQGTFAPQLDVARIERLLRSPDRFEVRLCRIAGVRLEVLERLSRAFLDGNQKQDKTVLNVVRRIMRSIAALPEYVRTTSNLSTRTQAIREALLNAREPAQLLFVDLPAACGLGAFAPDKQTNDKTVDLFFAELRKSLGELQMAYPNLLARLEYSLGAAFGLRTAADDLRSDVRDKLKPLAGLVVDPNVRAFVLRCTDDLLDRQEWTVSVATQLASKPPSVWRDVDEHQFGLSLTVAARRLRALEALVVSEGPGGLPVLRVSVAATGAAEQERVVNLHPKEKDAIDRARQSFVDLATQLGESGHIDSVLAGLGLAAHELLIQAAERDLRLTEAS